MKIFKLGAIPQEIYDSVGGKARGLDFLVRNGFSVPRGFIATDLSDCLSDEELSRIEAAFDELGAERVSVRSSATNEDGTQYSSAGQYETKLDVTRDKLKAAANECIESLRSERAAAYSQNLTSAQTDAKMNLVVQQMADAVFAGVVFTSNPTDKDSVLIEAVEGAGENLVSGTKSSHAYSVKKSGFEDVSDGALNKEQLEALYTQSLKIAKIYGKESDLEWVIDGEGKLYWLQLRPITTLEDAEEGEFDTKNPLENHMLTTRNIGEMLPGAITPLSISTSVLAIDYGIRNMLYKIGAIKSIDSRPDYYIALAYKHRLFMDMSALHTMSKRVALASQPAMNLSIMGEYIEEFPKVEGKKAFFLTRLVNAAKFGKYMFSSKKAKERLVKLSEELVIEDKETPRQLYDEITKKLPAINEALCNHYVCSSFSGAMNSGLYMTLAKNFDSPAEYQAFISTVLSDINGIESADILCSLREIGQAVLKINSEAAKLSEKELLSLLIDANNKEAYELYGNFIKKHGHRSIKEAEMRSKAWKNDPLSLMTNLKTVMSSMNTQTDVENDTHNSKDLKDSKKEKFNLDEFIKSYKGKGKGALKFLAPRARQAVVDREFSKSNIIKVIDKFKDKYSKLAELLVQDRYLVDEDSIYFLSHDEIGALIDGDTALKRKALSRRARFGEYEDLSFDDICIGTPKPLDSNALSAESELKGIPVSKGKVTGRARIVKCAADAEKLQAGEIMVAPFTDIGWSPYYSLVGALVTEVGSALSHGAVVAREYCLPTVVNVKNATKYIKDGDKICVNASSGTVSILS